MGEKSASTAVAEILMFIISEISVVTSRRLAGIFTPGRAYYPSAITDGTVSLTAYTSTNVCIYFCFHF